MTIAIAIKVHDGLVLAADSASTLMGSVGTGPAKVLNVYNNANKIFNLRKGMPIGGMTWGAGSIGHASISTLAKDIRAKFSGNDPEWKIDTTNWSIEDIAKTVRRFLFEDHYQRAYGSLPEDQRPTLGFLIVGYSSDKDLAEGWLIEIARGGTCAEPKPVIPVDADTGGFYEGQYEAVHRLLMGHGIALDIALRKLGVPAEQIALAVENIGTMLQANLITAPMPIQDVIDLAEFLASAAAMYSRFSFGASSVGGPVEVAAITKHEGFKWVKRKHYFNAALNPDEGIGR